jgi:hypothetical protein
VTGSRLFTILIVVESLAIVLAKWPNQMLFELYAFGDQGAVLAADRLLVEGWRPGVDFNYLYGLISLLVGRIVFGMFGCTPLVYAISTSAIVVGLALVLAQTAVALRTPLVGRVLLVVALPVALAQLPQLNFAHAVEGLLLASAVYLQARGKDSWALAAATAAVLTKPALGYVYGLILLIRLALFSGVGSGSWVRRLAHALLPAAGTGVVLVVILVLWFGLEPLVQVLLPFKGQEVYRQENYGFFTGRGQWFWKPERANYRYYLGTPAGFWIAATIMLGVVAMVGTIRRSLRTSPAFGVVVSCAILHFVFVVFAFGNNFSWPYYAYLLVVGIVAATALGGYSAQVVGVLAAAALLGHYSLIRGVEGLWRNCAPSPVTANLYAPKDLALEWNQLLDLAQTQRVFVLNYIGGVFVIEPRIDSTRAWCFYSWMATTREQRELLDRLQAADVVVLPKFHIREYKPWDNPWVADALTAFPRLLEWKYFYVLFRNSRSKDAH